MLKAFKKLLSNGSVTRKTLFCLIFSKLPVLGLCLTKVVECYWWPKGFRFKGQVAEMMLYWKTNKLLLPMPPVFLVFFFRRVWCLLSAFLSGAQIFVSTCITCEVTFPRASFPQQMLSPLFSVLSILFSLVGEIEVFCSLQDISWQVSQSKTWFASFWTRERV